MSTRKDSKIIKHVDCSIRHRLHADFTFHCEGEPIGSSQWKVKFPHRIGQKLQNIVAFISKEQYLFKRCAFFTHPIHSSLFGLFYFLPSGIPNRPLSQ